MHDLHLVGSFEMFLCPCPSAGPRSAKVLWADGDKWFLHVRHHHCPEAPMAGGHVECDLGISGLDLISGFQQMMSSWGSSYPQDGWKWTRSKRMRYQCCFFAVPAVDVEFSFNLCVREWCVVCLPRPNTGTESERRNSGSTVLLGFKAGLIWDAWSMTVAKFDTSNIEKSPLHCHSQATASSKVTRYTSLSRKFGACRILTVWWRLSGHNFANQTSHFQYTKHDFFIHSLSSFSLNFSASAHDVLPFGHNMQWWTCWNILNTHCFMAIDIASPHFWTCGASSSSPSFISLAWSSSSPPNSQFLVYNYKKITISNL